MKVVAAIKLTDGSTIEAAFNGNAKDIKERIENSINKNTTLKIEHPKYGDLFGHEYIVAKHIISFRLSESKG
ncbi:hypothetical protein ACA30_05815 [Virgibacillus soli]|nr:hypothetical protein ACA30_05815 [Virgibacillus soli]